MKHWKQVILATALTGVAVFMAVGEGQVQAEDHKTISVTAIPTQTICVMTYEAMPVEPEQEQVREKQYFDVPLDHDLQDYIETLCEVHHIDPAIVVAMIGRESNYQADVVGDGGDSFGLMQVQPKWHQERMDMLGCTDLLDPYQNVLVGVDYLAELIERDKGIEWALAAYNAGASGANKGYGSTYASNVLARAGELNAIH